MKANILLVANGDIDSDLPVIDAAARTAHGVRRASTQSRPWQILRRNLANIDAVIVDLDKHSQALSIVEALGCSENAPPVIVLTNTNMAPVAYRHGATVLRYETIHSRRSCLRDQQRLSARPSIRSRAPGAGNLRRNTQSFPSRAARLKPGFQFCS